MDQAPATDPLSSDAGAGDAVAPAGPAPVPRAAPPLLGSFRLPCGVEILLAIVQVILVCGIPTQVVVLAAFYLANQPLPSDFLHIPLQFMAMTSLFDTALVAVLIRVFLSASGETSREVFIGPRRPFGEIWRGLALVPVTILVVQVMAYGLRLAFPALHTVEENPYAEYMRSPVEAAIFIVVVILAGGLREELQRAFILRRFDQHLGGAWIGLALFSLLFGALHVSQGIDAAIVIGLLGALYGLLYLRRRSAVLPITAHAGFDVGMVLLQYFGRALGI